MKFFEKILRQACVGKSCFKVNDATFLYCKSFIYFMVYFCFLLIMYQCWSLSLSLSFPLSVKEIEAYKQKIPLSLSYKQDYFLHWDWFLFLTYSVSMLVSLSSSLSVKEIEAYKQKIRLSLPLSLSYKRDYFLH